MGFTLLTSLVLSSFVATVYYSGYNLDITSESDHQEVEKEEHDLPLLLTPLIESGNIDKARRKSIVEHEGLRDIISYSGFLTVNREYNSNLFFWFFPAQMISKSAPIVIWLQGGPGESSLLGLFSENGPFAIAKDQTVKNRENSWTKPLNMLYIDNPVGTGYSFTDHDYGYADNQLSVGIYLYEALTQFFKMFPELRTNDVYVAGESFGGKYATALSYAIHAMNPAVDNVINLKGLAIFSGSLDSVVRSAQPAQTNHQFYNFLDFETVTQFFNYERKIQNLIEKPSSIDLNDVLSLVSETSELFSNLPPFSDGATAGTDEEYDSEILSKFMESEEIKRAIHVGDRTFVISSERVRKSLEADMTQSLGNVFKILLENYRVLIVNGELDTLAPASGFERSLMKLDWSGNSDLMVASGKPWKVAGDLAGAVKTAGKLVEVVVKNSRGSVIKYHPVWMLELITKFTAGENIV